MSRIDEHPPSAPVIGWRYWQLDDTLRLRSLSQRGHTWLPDHPLVARCVGGVGEAEGGHRSPGADCGCGIHASRDMASLQAQALCLRPVPLVVGQVRLWGPVITEDRADHHGQDHRGRFASPQRLWVVPETLPSAAVASEAVTDLAATYSVRVGLMALEEATGEASRTILGFLAMSAATSPPP